MLPPDPRHQICRYLIKNQYLSGNCWDISLWLLTRATLYSLLFETIHVNSIASHNIPGADRTRGTSVRVENVNILSNTVWVDLCVWLRVKVTSLSGLNPSPGAKFPQCLWALSALPSPLRYTSLWVCVCVYMCMWTGTHLSSCHFSLDTFFRATLSKKAASSKRAQIWGFHFTTHTRTRTHTHTHTVQLMAEDRCEWPHQSGVIVLAVTPPSHGVANVKPVAHTHTHIHTKFTYTHHTHTHAHTHATEADRKEWLRIVPGGGSQPFLWPVWR